MKLFTDGASRNNPGEAGGGIVLRDGEDEWTRSKYFGKKTNNEAEYLALIEGLKLAKEQGAGSRETGKKLEVFMDSELIVKQIKGEYKVKKNTLIPLFNEVKTLLKGLNWSITHILRHKNGDADKLANQAIDSKLSDY
ncbi:MAG: ribonuclease HI family protein [Candidatus Altiarchaeota archaeon]|nr:ribonuclease HI family protein [Candidatus Altiarchaeota archaeon]